MSNQESELVEIQPPKKEEKLNWWCETFGHRFTVASDKEEIPATPDDIFNMLQSIKKGSTSSHVASSLQERVDIVLRKTTSNYVFCKRCGKVVKLQ